MSVKWKFLNPRGIYAVSYSTINWIDVFTRVNYKEIIVESIRYCQQNKGLELYCWCLMTNHAHMIVSAAEGHILPDIFRDMKKFMAKELLQSIATNPKESRKEWMMAMFEREGKFSSRNSKYQFWQHDNHPVELWSNTAKETQVNYIHNNPVVAGIVDEPQHYIYSSARNYCGMIGKLEVLTL